MKILGIAAVNLRRSLRERVSLFLIFVFPLLLILILGLAFGGSGNPRVAVASADSGRLSRDLVAALRHAPGIDVTVSGTSSDVYGGVERGRYDAGLVVPAGYDAALRSGTAVTVAYVARPGLAGQQVGAIVSAVVDRQSGRLLAARAAQRFRGVGVNQGLVSADSAATAVPRVTVRLAVAGGAVAATPGRFDTGASSQLVLFLFITSLTGGVALVETRRLGMSRRMLATPTSGAVIVTGEALGRLAVALLQGGVVMLGSRLLFGVRWGDPLAAAVLMICFALVSAGAGMLLGALARSIQQAIAIGLLIGLSMAALGGAMMPLDLFSPTMRRVAHLTPHAWALDGFAALLRHGGNLATILPELGVLVGAALVLLTLASWRLRHVVSR